MDALYIGDYKLQSNEFLVGADSFKTFYKKIRDYEPLLETLQEAPGVSVDYLDGPDTMTDFPRSVEELAEYDTLIVSDLSRGTLEPHFYPDSIPGPNLLRIVHDFVKEGGGLVYCGGWMTFQGYQGVGNWHGTPVADTLPVDIRPIYDDRVERPEGAEATVTNRNHPVMDAVGDESLPVVYGYNQVAGLREGAAELATVDGNPLLVVSEYGQGRVLTYTSDPGIKWGLDLVEWGAYDEFWLDAVAWAAGE